MLIFYIYPKDMMYFLPVHRPKNQLVIAALENHHLSLTRFFFRLFCCIVPDIPHRVAPKSMEQDL